MSNNVLPTKMGLSFNQHAMMLEEQLTAQEPLSLLLVRMESHIPPPIQQELLTYFMILTPYSEEYVFQIAQCSPNYLKISQLALLVHRAQAT